jgi:prepilin-type N-terminal cleavage/methylation domain-containing protein/prepilin-type processing-associated H-X9-DG protein
MCAKFTLCSPSSRPVLFERRGAFTLIELLTVIAIIGILAAILIPVVGRARESARGARCISNLRQVGVAIYAYADDNRGSLPPTGFFGIAPYYNRDARNFQHALLPYLQLRRAANWGTSVEQSVYSAVFDCPSYKGSLNGKGYLAQENLTLPDSSTVKPWGLVKDANGTDINPKPRRLVDMPSSAWAIRDHDATVDGVVLQAHPSARNALFFGGHVNRQPLN